MKPEPDQALHVVMLGEVIDHAITIPAHAILGFPSHRHIKVPRLRLAMMQTAGCIEAIHASVFFLAVIRQVCVAHMQTHLAVKLYRLPRLAALPHGVMHFRVAFTEVE